MEWRDEMRRVMRKGGGRDRMDRDGEGGRHSPLPPSLLLLLLPFHLTYAASQHSSEETALKTNDPFDTFPKNYWQEFTSPYTEAYEEEGGLGRGGMGPNGAAEEEEGEVEEETTTPEPAPFFEDLANSTNITARVGKAVTLHCKVNDIRNKTVSWVRRKGGEPQLITFGLHTYSSDSRYSLNYQLPNDWKLQIKHASQRDQGHYECQVSTHPPAIFHVFLAVVEPKVEIVDERGAPIVDKFYKESSTIDLKCVISYVSPSSSYVTWKHGQRILNYDTSRGGISVKTEILEDSATSRLFVAHANKHDSGNYTCSLGDVASTTVYIHVLKEENPAAMQHEGRGVRNLGGRGWLIFLLIFLPRLLLAYIHQSPAAPVG